MTDEEATKRRQAAATLITDHGDGLGAVAGAILYLADVLRPAVEAYVESTKIGGRQRPPRLECSAMTGEDVRFRVTFLRPGVRFEPEYTRTLAKVRRLVWDRFADRWLSPDSAQIVWKRKAATFWNACDPAEVYFQTRGEDE